MKVEDYFVIALVLSAFLFLIGLARVVSKQRKKKKHLELKGYQLKKGHLDFHIAFVKNYPQFTLAFFPLLDPQMVTSFQTKTKNHHLGFKGIACLYSSHDESESSPMLDLISTYFYRQEKNDEGAVIFYKEDCDFMSDHMREFVATLDGQIESALKESSMLSPLSGI